MSTTRIEGSLWHTLPEQEAIDAETAMDAQKFMQLIAQKATHCASSPLSPHAHRRQRYRMVTGDGEVILCEISERAGELHLCIQVSQRELFDTLSLISSWLCARLREAGHAVVLEVDYVKDDPGSVEPGTASSS
ncbi:MULTISPECIES: hypothetical protein [unclassified Symbiopectobacterium]|uniref:hypothetical protein n=1 Tax=unclassified Symbiopectobacterium TaxID=2794573 RepID=UPI002226CA19|nr:MULTISPECIES: hypothetical protein [unclassified Symbiopectobacterium]MCW2474982.1 hypothetical protein [Candidatus Symbiopectobacterium sp. NZEC151]MCW2482423.1 hypothetical protein [Candidatus Symbiopectobacterium sp. NZEC135]